MSPICEHCIKLNIFFIHLQRKTRSFNLHFDWLVSILNWLCVCVRLMIDCLFAFLYYDMVDIFNIYLYWWIRQPNWRHLVDIHLEYTFNNSYGKLEIVSIQSIKPYTINMVVGNTSQNPLTVHNNPISIQFPFSYNHLFLSNSLRLQYLFKYILSSTVMGSRMSISIYESKVVEYFSLVVCCICCCYLSNLSRVFFSALHRQTFYDFNCPQAWCVLFLQFIVFAICVKFFYISWKLTHTKCSISECRFKRKNSYSILFTFLSFFLVFDRFYCEQFYVTSTLSFLCSFFKQKKIYFFDALLLLDLLNSFKRSAMVIKRFQLTFVIICVFV